MLTILASIGMVGFLMVALMLRVILGKDEEFRGTCASMDPILLAKGVKCGCGKKAGTCSNSNYKSEDELSSMPAIGK